LTLDFRCKMNEKLIFEIDIPIKHTSVNLVLDYDCTIPGGWWLSVTKFAANVWWWVQLVFCFTIIYFIFWACCGAFCLYPGSTVISRFSKLRSFGTSSGSRHNTQKFRSTTFRVLSMRRFLSRKRKTNPTARLNRLRPQILWKFNFHSKPILINF
jgi:hypothetical protein